MQRTVELFIKKGKIKKTAPDVGSKVKEFGIIEISSSEDSPDQKPIIVFTHSKHSFTNPQTPPTENETVWFFLIPLEYLFVDIDSEDILGHNDEPLLAVNVTPIFPYIITKPNNQTKRHPCTTALTIAPDSFDTYPPNEDPYTYSSFLLLPIMSIYFFFKKLFHPNTTYFYGINDYGEFAIIQSRKEDRAIIVPWFKIWLDPIFSEKNAHFNRAYSPKREGERKVECQILKQNFMEEDDLWTWNIFLLKYPNWPNDPRNPKNPQSPLYKSPNQKLKTG